MGHKDTHPTLWFIGISQGFEFAQKEELEFTALRNRERRGRQRMLTERRRRGAREASRLPEDRRRRAVVAGGEGKSPERRHARNQRRNEVWPRARAGEGFLKTDYGRAGQSTVPVWCTPNSTQ
jgi:hypothetical protein